jgi:hypothetical protein
MQDQRLSEVWREEAQANLLRFTAWNAVSFEVLAGQILILFARQVGASLAAIGLLAALLPFASVVQLGVAPLVARFGPRALLRLGWATRTVVALALLGVPLAAARGGSAAATETLLGAMAAFHLCRALGLSSWFPLVQEIVPHDGRAAFISRQEWLRQVSVLGVSAVAAAYLSAAASMPRFVVVITGGVVAAAISLVYIWRLPEVGKAAEPLDRYYLRRAAAPLRDPLFRNYLLLSVTLRAVLCACSPLVILFLRDRLQLPAAGVIALNTVGSLGALATLSTWGRWSGAMGARPVLGVSTAGLALSLLLWVLAGTGPEWRWVGAPAILLLVGIFSAGITIALSQFELGFIPARGRDHYVAINSTAVGLGSGCATLAAGHLLQGLGNANLQVAGRRLDPYHLLFILASLLLLPLLLGHGSLPENGAFTLPQVIQCGARRRLFRVREARHAIWELAYPWLASLRGS